MSLSMDDVPGLPHEVRLRVLAAALDPDAPPAAAELVPADTLSDDPLASAADLIVTSGDSPPLDDPLELGQFPPTGSVVLDPPDDEPVDADLW